MEPLSFSALMVVASLCMPPRRSDQLPYIISKEQVELTQPVVSVGGVRMPVGSAQIGVRIEYLFRSNERAIRMTVEGNVFDVYEKVQKVLAPNVCSAVG